MVSAVTGTRSQRAIERLAGKYSALKIGALLLWVAGMVHVYTSQHQWEITSNFTEQVAVDCGTKITSWEQIEELMRRIDPAKAQRWISLAEADIQKKLTVDTPEERPEILSSSQSSESKTLAQADEEHAAINSRQVQEWRKGFHEAAAIRDTKKRRSETEKFATNPFDIQTIRKCKHVFLDFGANVGDTLLKFVDTFNPKFESKASEGNIMYHQLNTTTGSLGPMLYGRITSSNTKKAPYWILPPWIKGKIEKYNADKNTGPPVHPEDYCYYGVEGNPHFTSLLRHHEINMLNMVPRPVRHVHFLTEHVGAGIDGPTALYLDTINSKQNYWGSSIMETHRDVVRSNSKTGVPVTGITLTRLLTETVLPGGHVMIKIDIEGAEYALLEEAINSTIFCKLVKDQGVRIDMVNEFHHKRVTGTEELGKRWIAMKGDKHITECGVQYSLGMRGMR
mmetsp:Transcript_23719/g.39228  ORF Transcript_23719/g.39228 Transcript_23719/m.39228 type:complete len:451 (+) Transcript_23719:54-1406(+)